MLFTTKYSTKFGYLSVQKNNIEIEIVTRISVKNPFGSESICTKKFRKKKK